MIHNSSFRIFVTRVIKCLHISMLCTKVVVGIKIPASPNTDSYMSNSLNILFQLKWLYLALLAKGIKKFW